MKAVEQILRQFRSLGPYLAIELILPGGSIVALLLWIYRRRARLLGRRLARSRPWRWQWSGGGVLTKYLRSARWPEVPISFEVAARATSSQVQDLVRYVEQSNANFVESLQECP